MLEHGARIALVISLLFFSAGPFQYSSNPKRYNHLLCTQLRVCKITRKSEKVLENGAVWDGAVQKGTLQDGTVQDGTVQDGTVQDGEV